MGKVNVWVKRAYYVVISLIAIIGLMLLGLTLFSHGHFHNEEELDEIMSGLHVMYSIAVVAIVLTIIGAFGAYKEKKWALILFVVGMILSSLFLFGIEIQALAVQPKISKELKSKYLHMLPLSNASEIFIESLNEVQRDWQCCGLDYGYLDWDDNIPESCLCVENAINPCVTAPRSSRLFEGRLDGEPIMIFSQACLPFLADNVMGVIKNAVGIMMAVTLLLVLSVVLGIITLCQMNRKLDIPPVVYSPEAKAGNYTTLTEVAEET